MKIVIHDASLLIDLHRCGLLETWLAGGVEAHTSDLVMLEMTQPMHDLVARGLLHVCHLDTAELLELTAFQAGQPRSLSFEDCSVLSLAIQMQTGCLNQPAVPSARAVPWEGRDCLLPRSSCLAPALGGTPDPSRPLKHLKYGNDTAIFQAWFLGNVISVVSVKRWVAILWWLCLAPDNAARLPSPGR